MTKNSILADCLKNISHADRLGRKQVLIRPVNKILIKFLLIMLKYEYIIGFQFIDDQRAGKIVVNLNGRINNCGCITPRFNIKLREIEKYRNKIIPSKVFGILILTTSLGIIDSRIAIKKRVSGRLLGFFY